MKKETEWKRNCPKCGKDLYYVNKYSLARAIENESKCGNCKQKIFINPNIIYKRDCPICRKIIYYSTEQQLNAAINNKTKCRSCCNPKGKNSPTYGKKRSFSKEHRKNISKSKKGNQFWLGKHHSKTTKKKQRLAKKT